MCEEHVEILAAVNSLQDEFVVLETEVGERLRTLEEQSHETNEHVRDLENCFHTTRYREVIDRLDVLVCGDSTKGQLGLETIVNGSEALGVEPMRKTLGRVATSHDRWIWLAGIMGVGTIGSLIAWIAFFLSRGPMP